MELSPNEAIARGHAAEQLLINETFNAVCEDILRERSVHWLAETDAEKCEVLHVDVRVIYCI